MHPLDFLKFEPDHMVYIDFETAYDPKSGYTLSKIPAVEYIRSPLFEVIGVGVQVDDEPAEWLEEHEFRAFASAVDWSKCTVVGHNLGGFDALIMAFKYGIRAGAWVDTLPMARAKHGTTIGNSLKKLMDYYQVGQKGDEVVRAQGKWRKDFTREEWLKYGEYCRNDVFGCKELLPLLAEGFPELEFWAVDATIRMATEPRFILDEPFLEEYLIYERKRKADLMRSIAGLPEGASDEEVAVKVKPVLMSNDKFARLLLHLGVVPPKKISVAKTKLAGEPVLTWAFAKSDPGMQDLLEHSNDDVRMVAEARVGVKSTINESRTVRMLKMGKDGQTLPVTLNCYAAHTGRWGGAGKTNMQNLERVNPKKPRSGALRKAMLAPPGHKVVVVDSAAIEARGTAWLAEDESLVAQFAADVDVYSRFASLIFRRPISKKDKQERALGKVSILGLGYGMGWAKFSMVLAAGPMGNDPILFDESTVSDMGADIREFLRNDKKMARVEDIPSRMPGKESARIACKALAGMRINDRAVHCAVAEYIVNLYRQENGKIVELWETMNGVLEAMLDEDESFSFGPDGVFTTQRHAIQLPSGRILRYPGLEEDDGRFSYLGDHKQRVGSWGGALTENIVQAFCRDVVTEQMLMVQAQGFRARLMAHDEVVLVEPDAVAPQALACLVAAMKVAPDWAVGLPVSSEGGVGDSYGGSKA